jgi:hypothetical protein
MLGNTLNSNVLETNLGTLIDLIFEFDYNNERSSTIIDAHLNYSRLLAI